MTRVPCFHVHTSTGDVYGVAAWNKTEARLFLARRLAGQEPEGSVPTTAERVGTWTADYGTVLWY